MGLPRAACENDFNLGHTKFERVVSGIKRAGGHEYGKKRKVRADELPTGAVKPKKKKQNPVDKGQAGSVKTGIACKYCNKVCLNDETLSIHVNNEHADKQPMFQCAFCGIKLNELRLYIKHLGDQSKDMYKCYKCGKQFDNAHLLRKHVTTHINQCPLCSRTFESLLVLVNHANNSHGKALTEDLKKCQYCDAAFNTFDELSTHCKGHRSYFCDICYAGFISEPLLVEHRVNDHPEGCPAEISECTPTPRAKTPEITITKIVDPEKDKAMEVVHTPDPDPFADKWHPALGQTHKDSQHKIECEVCHRYLKSSDLWVEHVKHFHPTVSYDCRFCPGVVLYTLQDLLKHCTDLYFVCQQCDSALKDKDALKEHMASEHQSAPQPAQATAASTVSNANVCPAQPKPGFVCGMCSMYCQTEASFRIHITTHTTHKNFTMLPAGTSTLTWSTMTGVIENLIAGWLQPVRRHSTPWRSSASTQGGYTRQHSHLDALTKIVLTVSELLMIWLNMARLMARSHGMTPTLQRTRRIGTSVLSVMKHLIYLPN